MTEPNETNLLARALEAAERKNHEQGILLGSLTAEVNMLKDALDRSETDRIRLEAVSSQLLGRLLAINSVIGDAVKASIKHGIEAVEEARPEPELEQAANEVRGILQRVAPVPQPLERLDQTPPPRAPQAVGGPLAPVPFGGYEPRAFRR